MISGTCKPCTLCTVAEKCHFCSYPKSLNFSVLGDKYRHPRQAPKWAVCNYPKSLHKILSMKSGRSIFTNLYKVFFLNDSVDLQLFFGTWHLDGTGPAIYKGVSRWCAHTWRPPAPIGAKCAVSLTFWSPCLFAGLRWSVTTRFYKTRWVPA